MPKKAINLVLAKSFGGDESLILNHLSFNIGLAKSSISIKRPGS